MFYVTYMVAELRRRLGRTILTALGLGIGVGLVVTVTALSNGLDEAQAKVLEPLTGVGTDMSVSRPIEMSAPGSGQGNGPFGQLSEEEREQLREEKRWRAVPPPESGRAG
jgi:ABC-type lipoprotein release transport system permease subunit